MRPKAGTFWAGTLNADRKANRNVASPVVRRIRTKRHRRGSAEITLVSANTQVDRKMAGDPTDAIPPSGCWNYFNERGKMSVAEAQSSRVLPPTLVIKASPRTSCCWQAQVAAIVVDESGWATVERRTGLLPLRSSSYIRLSAMMAFHDGARSLPARRPKALHERDRRTARGTGRDSSLSPSGSNATIPHCAVVA